jgi:hypothetical protein
MLVRPIEADKRGETRRNSYRVTGRRTHKHTRLD